MGTFHASFVHFNHLLRLTKSNSDNKSTYVRLPKVNKAAAELLEEKELILKENLKNIKITKTQKTTRTYVKITLSSRCGRTSLKNVIVDISI